MQIGPGPLASLLALLITTSAAWPMPNRTQVYSYPADARLEDGSKVSGPVTFQEAQATTDMPDISELSGVLIIVLWSDICPQPNVCNFTMISHILSYWQAKGKKVVLDVATNGYPVEEHVVNGRAQYTNVTPSWVLRSVRNYSASTRIVGPHPATDPKFASKWPDYRDPAFLRDVQQLAHQLAEKFDGSPALATVRIPYGIYGEENPEIGPPCCLIDGFTEDSWLDFVSGTTLAFEQEFKKSQLECDLSRTVLVYQTGELNYQNKLFKLIGNLKANHVLFGYNGFGPANANSPNNKLKASFGMARGLLTEFSAAGIGSEAEGAPLWTAVMQPTSALANLLQQTRPWRYDAWADDIGAVAYRRGGHNAAIASVSLSNKPAIWIQTLANRMETIFAALGYPEHAL